MGGTKAGIRSTHTAGAGSKVESDQALPIEKKGKFTSWAGLGCSRA